MSNSKPKSRDDSTDKFLQRIAGRKALAPPPTPRPVIGEHPVRILIRENSDDETAKRVKPEDEKPLLEVKEPVLPMEHARNELRGEADAPTDEKIDSQINDLVGSRNAAKEISPIFTESKSVKRTNLHTSAANAKVSRIIKEASLTEKKQEPLSISNTVIGNAEEQLNNTRVKYRLNSGEFAVYKELFMMTHAVGKIECSFVVSELMNATCMLERRVRDNIRRLKENGWIVMLESYDFQNRGKPKYRVNIEPEI